MSISYSLTPQSITVTVGFVPKTIPATHPHFAEIVALARDPKTTQEQIVPLLDIGKTVERLTDGNVVVKNGKLFMRGYEVKSNLANMIIQLVREGNEAGAEPLKLFMEKAWANPDPRAATDLFDWVVNSKLPITPDGNILAWKAVGDDYMSLHKSRREGYVFDHHIGNTVEEDRSYCDANPDNTCSRGLHFASAAYMKHYAGGGSRIVALEISPTDVVAFPRDYGWEKGRAAKYVVVGEVPEDQVADFYPQGKRVYRWNPTTPAQSKLGDVWLNRKGEETTVIRINTDQSYPVQTDTGLFTGSGAYVDEYQQHPLDLVKFVR